MRETEQRTSGQVRRLRDHRVIGIPIVEADRSHMFIAAFGPSGSRQALVVCRR